MKESLFLLIIFCLKQASSQAWSQAEEFPNFWIDQAKEELDAALNLEGLNKNVAKNIIILLGDGMGVPTITAGRILKGQLQNKSGEETILAMDKFSHTGLSKTYAVDKQVSDSACTATAYLCGVKSNYYTIGLSGKARRDNCSSSKGNEVDSILVDAYKAGKSTGFVTTTRVNHATPAGLYAHTPSRNWYGDRDLTVEAKRNGCKDIAQQFYDNSIMFTVALGGGRKYFQPRGTFDPEYPNRENDRRDDQDLIAMWLNDRVNEGLNGKYVWNKTDFDNVDPEKTDRLLGLFEDSDMRFEADRASDKGGEPSLAEMTEKAIRMLEKNPEGYFLLVEGGRIDHGHHAGNAYGALHDFVAFDDAVEKAVEMTSESDTLIIVTADHSHTFNFGGYTDRGNPIFGLAVSEGKISLGLDRKPFTSLLYGNGIGYQGFLSSILDPHSPRENLTSKNTESRAYFQQSAVPLVSETHGGEDVPIMAMGPMSHLIHGVHQQSYIAYVMRFASCIGFDTRHCERDLTSESFTTTHFHPTSSNKPTSTSSSTSSTSSTSSSLSSSSTSIQRTNIYCLEILFLNMQLDASSAELALHIQFGCLVAFFVLSVFLILRHLLLVKKLNKLSTKSIEGIEKL